MKKPKTTILVALALAACGRQAREPLAARPVPRPCPAIAAHVNGRPLHMTQLRLLAELSRKSDSALQDRRADAYQNGLSELIRREVLYQEAQAQQVVADPARSAATEQETRALFPNEKSFLDFLAQQGHDLASYREELRLQETARELTAREARTVPTPGDAQAAEYFQAYNPGKKPSAEELEGARMMIIRANSGEAIRQLLERLTAKAKVERHFQLGECDL
jgi:peptidyl-prolyl cis-trans isomerase C